MKENSIEEDIKIALDKFSDNKDIDSAILIIEKFILGNYILRGGRKNIVKDSLRYILSDYKRALKEANRYKNMYEEEHEIQLVRNEQLDRKEKAITRCGELENENKELKKKNIELQKENEEYSKQLDLDYVDKNYIPVQKVKDKIRHYQELQDNYIKKYDEINEGLQAMINVLQELIEESEE